MLSNQTTSGGRPDSDYLCFDPFQGDEAERKCKSVKLVRARKEHTCYTLNGAQDHTIKPGERYRHEKALIDGDFWGQYRICLRCMDKLISETHDCGEDAEDEE